MICSHFVVVVVVNKQANIDQIEYESEKIENISKENNNEKGGRISQPEKKYIFRDRDERKKPIDVWTKFCRNEIVDKKKCNH